MKINIVFVCLFSLLLLSCSKNNDTNDLIDHLECTNTNAHVLFQSDYENNAWSYTHRGWFINCQGTCRAYNLNKDSSWKNDNNTLTSEELHHNYQLGETNFHQIDTETLSEMYAMAIAVENGSLENVLPHMADAGIQEYSSYRYEESNNLYKKILLHQEGDFNIINHHPNIITLKEWLVQVQQIYTESIY